MNVELLDIWRGSGLTVIFITHNISEAVLLSQRVYIMATAPGRIIDHLMIELEKRDVSSFENPRFSEYYRHIDSAIGNIQLEKAI
jgi:NitT/TauT family transport system ATP-binding protein